MPLSTEALNRLAILGYTSEASLKNFRRHSDQ
jgi:hypothetical protein